MSAAPIALVTHRYAPAIGGVERVVEQLARGLIRRGIAVEVVTTDPTGDLPAVEQRDGVLVRRFPTVANDSVYYVAPQLGAWLWRNAARFALIHAHSYHTALAPQAALAAWGAGTPLLLSPYYHGGGHSARRRALHLPYRMAGHWMVRQARRLIYISQAERALFERHFGPGRAHLVAPCGVETESLLAAQPHARPAGHTIILAVGRLESYKQTDRLVMALPLLPPAYELVVIGNGPLRPRIEQLAAELGVRQRLRLLDHVSQPELLAWYRSTDVFVSLSRNESFGMTLLEGAAAGAAIVASDIPAHREVAGYVPSDRVIFVDPDCAAAELGHAVALAAWRGRADDSGWYPDERRGWRLPSWDGMVDVLAQCYAEVIGERWADESWPSSRRLPSDAAGEERESYSPRPSQRGYPLECQSSVPASETCQMAGRSNTASQRPRHRHLTGLGPPAGASGEYLADALGAGPRVRAGSGERATMRILLISHSYTDPGYWDKLDALGRRVELAVVMPEAWRGYLHPAAPVPPNRAGAPWKQYRLKATWQGLAFRYLYDRRQLAQVLVDFRPDLVHVEEEPESLSMLQVSLLRRRYNFRLVFFSWENVHPQRLGWPVRRVTFGAADAGIVGNRAALERCKRLGFRKPLALIPQYGFDVASQPPRAGTTHSQRGRFVVGYAGRLVAEKGLRTLADATRGLPDVELLIAGSGPLAAELARQPHIQLLGALQRRDMDQFWNGIDLLALPSLTTPRWAEQFGRVLVEAIGRGVPVVGSSSGAIPEVIGDAGLIFPEGDAAALAAAIDRLRDDTALRADLIARGLEHARRCYSQDVIMEQIVDFYGKVLGCHARA